MSPKRRIFTSPPPHRSKRRNISPSLRLNSPRPHQQLHTETSEETQSDPLPDTLAPNPHRPIGHGNAVTPTKGSLIRPTFWSRTVSASEVNDIEGQVEDAAEGVKKAVEELAEMEERFKDVVKRQRMALLESGIISPAILDQENPAVYDENHHQKNIKKDTVGSFTVPIAATGRPAGTRGKKSSDKRKKTADREANVGGKRANTVVNSLREGQKKTDTPVIIVSNSDATSSPSLPVSSVRSKRTAKTPASFENEEYNKGNISDGDQDHRGDGVNENARVNLPVLVNSEELPLPWNGRLGYACLNTYLRSSDPPVFCSRTCRINSIIEHRHPLQDPSKPAHPIKNRPDKSKLPDPALGTRFLQSLGLKNSKDLCKLLRWNEIFGIKFMRISSEMFPFASHETYGYSLGFAADALKEAGNLVKQFGHRVSTHPGQFTQLGSPNPKVIEASIRDLCYHDEMLSLLKLPSQQDRDAVMIIHMGGTYGDKAATLRRFRDVWRSTRITKGIRKRLVLENDDVSWSVHDLLPLCEELHIPLVFDWHHHNIVCDTDKLRPGNLDISTMSDEKGRKLMDRILDTWRRKNITPKMHYSEPAAGAKTTRNMRKHSPRVETLPPCPNDMDLMIEAKDKEQAVFYLMRKFSLDGAHRFADIAVAEGNSNGDATLTDGIRVVEDKDGKSADFDGIVQDGDIQETFLDVGGTGRRVYWPEGREDILKVKKVRTKKVKTKESCAKDQMSKTAKPSKKSAEPGPAPEKEAKMRNTKHSKKNKIHENV